MVKFYMCNFLKGLLRGRLEPSVVLCTQRKLESLEREPFSVKLILGNL